MFASYEDFAHLLEEEDNPKKPKGKDDGSDNARKGFEKRNFSDFERA